MIPPRSGARWCRLNKSPRAVRTLRDDPLERKSSALRRGDCFATSRAPPSPSGKSHRPPGVPRTLREFHPARSWPDNATPGPPQKKVFRGRSRIHFSPSEVRLFEERCEPAEDGTGPTCWAEMTGQRISRIGCIGVVIRTSDLPEKEPAPD